jgi:FkbM family methyltransferase
VAKLARQLAAVWDPLVVYQLKGHLLHLPVSHCLPLFRALHPQFSENLGRLSLYVSERYPGAPMIDIGANIGDSAIIIRQNAANPLLCIEGHPYFAELLARNLATVPDINIVNALVVGPLADSDPAPRGIDMQHGTASVSPHAQVKANPSNLATILASHPKFETAKFVKIDTDGFDHQIILGAIKWLERARPVLFWELDLIADAAQDGPGTGVFKALRSIGYEGMLVYDNFGTLMCGLCVTHPETITGLAQYASSHQSTICYLDVCLFHHDDRDLFERSQSLEYSVLQNDGAASRLKPHPAG